MRKLLTLLAILLSYGILFAADEEKVPPPKPYVFSLGGLTPQQIADVKAVPGVVEVQAGERTKIVWQPFNDGPWKDDGSKFIGGAQRIYDYLVLKKKLGDTAWTHGGVVGHNAGSIIWFGPRMHGSYGVPKVFGMMFNDLKTGHNDIMRVTCYSEAVPGQLEHEMLRGLVGRPISIEKCGKGFVVVAGTGRSADVAWQISDQMFVSIDFCFDREMIAAYIERLGCITPSDYKVSVDQWVEEEIRWRIKQLDFDYAYGLPMGLKRLIFVDHLNSYFPETGQKYGDVGSMGKVVSYPEIWQFLYNCRNYLWANRHNFKSNTDSGMFVLKGNDLYDPKNPPELPEELRGPPKPTDEQIRASEVAAQKKEREHFEKCFYGQLNEWNSLFQASLTEGKNRFGFDVRYPFSELSTRMFKHRIIRDKQEAEAWLKEARGWLWANRDNFEYRTGGYYLNGPDRYDPKNPPELPPELIKPPEKVPAP